MEQNQLGGGFVNDDTVNVFGRAMLYIRQTDLENCGILSVLRLVRTEAAEQPDMEAAG